ncbi:CWF19-like protein 1 homolog [Arctopsyche grandis]|uniref:CWF19-like protein 1 homolog n=1 Tax=Arctopsyche grandis TaxID=121162 RepID=UPI00406D9AD9
MGDKPKLLICGDVGGKFRSVFDRVESINQKSGPFDLLLVTGRFFGQNNDELESYKKGYRKVAVPTYILGPSYDVTEDLYPENEGEELFPNVTYLGKRGLYTTTNGLKIAYLSGIQSKDDTVEKGFFTGSDCLAIRDACLRGQPEFRGIDILITAEWPSEVQNLDERKIDLGIAPGSDYVSWLAMHTKPRYHFVASPSLFYERQPYRNHSRQHDTRELATRFIALAPALNKVKEKWLYACILQPINKMRMMDLLQGTVDETACPYDTKYLAQHVPGAAKNMGNGQFFYDMNTSEGEFGGRKRKHRDDNQRDRKKPEFDTEKCWFCLLSPTVERHLIISVGEHSYLALAKGPLNEYHCLITPVAHHQSITQVPSEVKEEIDKFKKSLHKLYATMEDVPVFFERNFKTSHLQVQSVPVPKSFKSNLAEEFDGQAQAEGIELSVLSPEDDFCDIMPPGIPYFYVELPDGHQLYTRTKHTFPLQLARDILSSPSILDCEEKSDWRACQLSKEEEVKYVSSFREKFAPFDFTSKD